MQAYSDPAREDDSHSLPDIEIFYVSPDEAANNERLVEQDLTDSEFAPTVAGWYYWYCQPGCLPDSPPYGPYGTDAQALEDVRNEQADKAEQSRAANRIDGYDRDDLGESPDY